MFALLKKIWLGIDGYLLSKCQNFSDKFQRKTGKTNFLLTKIFGYLSIISYTAVLVYSILFIPTIAIIISFMVIVMTVAILSIGKAEKIILNNFQENNEALPAEILKERQHFSFARRLWLGALLLELIFIYLVLIFRLKIYASLTFFAIYPIYSVTLSISYYFASCETIPPVKGKIWQMIKGWFAVKKLLPARAKT